MCVNSSHEWHPSVFWSGDIAEKISKIKQQEGPDLHVDRSANLLQTLLKHDVVDAFWLKISPITMAAEIDRLPMARSRRLLR
jgi:dihydrofolate reductase